jgi:16S rRNA (cytosine1402-N4)-methyltransferase
MIHSNFRYVRNFLRYHKAVPVDGILADLGISSHQIDEAGRGFSTRFEASLDMRMDNRRKRKASDIINKSKTEELTRIFREYGEMPDAGKIARAIVKARDEQPIETTGQLIELLTPYAERGKENKYFAKLFQALRIEVNQELEALKELLRQGTAVLKPGGRFVIIAYHSLEDKLVKNYFRAGNFDGVIRKDFYGNELSPLKPAFRKAFVPGEKEIIQNPRARSAKLRAAIKM